MRRIVNLKKSCVNKSDSIKIEPITGWIFFVSVTSEGFEPSISWMRTKYPKPLDDEVRLTGL